MTYVAGDLAGACQEVEGHAAIMQLGIWSNGTPIRTNADTGKVPGPLASLLT